MKSASATWNALWSSCMTEPARKFMSTMQRSSCLLRKAECLMLFLALRHHYWRTLRKLPIRQVTAGVMMLAPSLLLPSPSQWGWIQKEERWQPFWTSLSEVIRSCRELLRCGCRKSNCRTKFRVPNQTRAITGEETESLYAAVKWIRFRVYREH